MRIDFLHLLAHLHYSTRIYENNSRQLELVGVFKELALTYIGGRPTQISVLQMLPFTQHIFSPRSASTTITFIVVLNSLL